MKKLLLLSAIALIATTASAVEVKPYIEGKINHNWLKADAKAYGFKKDFKDNMFGGALEVGAKINQFRVGLEGYYNDKGRTKETTIYYPVEMKTKGMFLNAYWDVPLVEPKNVKPYISAGVGYSWLKGTVDRSSYAMGKYSIKEKDWGWNIGLGVGYALNENVDLTLGYRYEDLGKIKKEGAKVHFTNSKVTLGLRYTF